MNSKEKKVNVTIIAVKNDRIFNFEAKSNEIIIDERVIKNKCYLYINNDNNNIQEYLQINKIDIKKVDILFQIRKSFINNYFEIINPVRIGMQKKRKI